MAVLDRERDESARSAGDVPCKGPTEPSEPDGAVRIFGNTPVRQFLEFGFPVDPGDEALDPLVHTGVLQGAVELAATDKVVMGGTEEQFALGNHAFKDSDRTDDRGDGDPRDIPFLTGRDVLAVVVGDVLVVAAADEMSAPVLGVGAAAGPQTLYFLRPHAGQVEADDHRGGGQVPHQARGFVEVEVLAPGPAVDLSGHGYRERAGPWLRRAELMAFSKATDLVGAAADGGRDECCGQDSLAAPLGGRHIRARGEPGQKVVIERGQSRGRARVGDGQLLHAPPFHPGGQDVVREVVDHADRPHQ